MGYKDPVNLKEKQKEYYERNKERIKERQRKTDAKRYEYHKQNAYDSISTGEIKDRHEWDMWCNKIKRGASSKHPYSEDFTSDVMFKMLIQGCFYCGDVATTIDRIDSRLEHTLDNCVECCKGCNNSKGASDPSTFIRKAYYRARGEYMDDDVDIWFVNKTKQSMCHYKRPAKKKEVPFTLSKEDFEILINGDCEYCKRSPTTYFGIDRVIPSLGYVRGNMVSCCWDCNNDKSEDDVFTMRARNERIADRVDAGELVIVECEKVILHKGKQSSSKKVCARGKVYANMGAASNALVMSHNYVCMCIRNGIDTDRIFEITNEFYEEYKDFCDDITKDMFIAFDHFYTNLM